MPDNPALALACSPWCPGATRYGSVIENIAES